MAKKRKKRKSSKVNSKNITKRIIVSCALIFLLTLLIVYIGYYMFGTNILEIGINKTTANYISFNDIFDTDTIKTNELRQLSDRKGKKSKCVNINVEGTNSNLDYEIVLVPININVEGTNSNLDYEIFLVPININVDYNHIKYYLTDNHNNELVFDNMGNAPLSDDLSGNVIYNGKLINKKENIKLRIWIDEDYSGELNNNIFEVKVKLK